MFIRAYGEKNAPLAEPKDFVLDWSGDAAKEQEKQSIEDMKSVLMQLANTQNRKVEWKQRKRRK